LGINLVENSKVEEVRKPLYGLFTDIPPRYDLINHLITLNMDKGWRKKASEACLAGRPRKFLDLCCGTGDLGIEVARRSDYPIEINGLDFSQPMLDRAASKAALQNKVKFVFTQGDASKMPYSDCNFDCIGISFAFRNLTYKNALAEKHVSEILRVLAPGGRCVIVESSQPESAFIRACNHFYMRQYVYHLGAWLSGNKPAYRYLAESACSYFSPSQLKDFLIKRGFSKVDYKALCFGAAGVYAASK
jgi:demethylmenaquinone methyltransferase / 2-methoxy-6-polyprenyl-1,4-benzoquinol methylase